MNELRWGPRGELPSTTLGYYRLLSGMDTLVILWDDPDKNYWEASFLDRIYQRRFFINEYPRNTEGMKRVMAEVELMVRLELA